MKIELTAEERRIIAVVLRNSAYRARAQADDRELAAPGTEVPAASKMLRARADAREALARKVAGK